MPIVFVAAVAVRCGEVKPVHGLAYPILGLPGFAGIVVEIYHMLNGLIAMCILTHTGYLHFPDLVDRTAVIAVVENGRHDEDGVQHLYKFFFAAHQIDQALNIVENAPAIVPAIAFGEGISPFEGAEGRLELSVFVFSAHQLMFRIEQIFIVLTAFGIKFYFFRRAVEGFGEFVDREVIVSVFKGTRRIFIDLIS